MSEIVREIICCSCDTTSDIYVTLMNKTILLFTFSVFVYSAFKLKQVLESRNNNNPWNS